MAVAEKAAKVTEEECSLEQRRLQLGELVTRLEAAQKAVSCHMPSVLFIQLQCQGSGM